MLHPVLDVGAAYGVATLPALDKGSTVYANDSSYEQLQILEDLVPQIQKDKLKLFPGYFPNELNFPKDSLGAILIARVLHFFEGPKIQEALKISYDWLSKGGRIFITAETPYLNNLKTFIPVYEERKRLVTRIY